MKRFLCGLICAVLLLGMVPAVHAVGVTDVMVVANCSEWVSLREAPDTTSKRLKTVRLGELVVDCQMSVNNFVYCCHGDTWGYILFQYLQPTTYSPAESFAGNQMVVNCTEWVSMREGPDGSSARVAKVPLGAVVTECMYYYAGDYILCKYNGKTGYISTAYLRSAYYSALKQDEKVVSDAAGKYPAIVGSMQVVNCSEWVSLRTKASASSSRITKVNLGEYVDHCVQVSDQFVYCRYKTLWGYIQLQYLQSQQSATAAPVIPPPTAPVAGPTALPGGQAESVFADVGLPSYFLASQLGEEVLDYTSIAGYTVLVRRAYGVREELMAVCYDPQMKPLWKTCVMASGEPGDELQTAAFVAGTEEAPVLVLYEVGTDFSAYRIGPWADVLWKASNSVIQAGGSLRAIADTDGKIYLAFYNHLMGLSPTGQILWSMAYDDDRIYWPFAMALHNGNLEVCFDTDVENADKCWMGTFNRGGQLLMLTSVDKPLGD